MSKGELKQKTTNHLSNECLLHVPSCSWESRCLLPAGVLFPSRVQYSLLQNVREIDQNETSSGYNPEQKEEITIDPLLYF